MRARHPGTIPLSRRPDPADRPPETLHRQRNQPAAALRRRQPTAPTSRTPFTSTWSTAGRGGQSARQGAPRRRPTTCSRFPPAGSASGPAAAARGGAPPAPRPAPNSRAFRDRGSREADEFYRVRSAARCRRNDRRVTRQAYAGLLWSKQFYHYVVKDWLEGDPDHRPRPRAANRGATPTGRTSSIAT